MTELLSCRVVLAQEALGNGILFSVPELKEESEETPGMLTPCSLPPPLLFFLLTCVSRAKIKQRDCPGWWNAVFG